MTSHWIASSVTAPTIPHSGGTKGKSTNQAQTIPNMPQPPKPPDKPLMPYVRYNKKMWDKLRGDGNSELKLWDISRMIGSKWREMSDEDKQPYFDEYEAEKSIYHEQLKVYHNSPSYKRWLEEKRLAEQAYHEAQQLQQQQQQENYAPPPPQIISPSHHQAHIDPRLSAMMTINDNEESEYVTVKQVATARYYRNHKLMAEIFNDTPVPDTRSAVTEDRLAMLQTQVQSLVHHQNKLEDELKQIENKFEERKRKIAQEQENFNNEIKKLCERPPMSWKKPVVHISLKDLPTHKDSGVQYTKL